MAVKEKVLQFANKVNKNIHAELIYFNVFITGDLQKSPLRYDFREMSVRCKFVQ